MQTGSLKQLFCACEKRRIALGRTGVSQCKTASSRGQHGIGTGFPQLFCLVEGEAVPTHCLLKVLVMSHEEGVGEGWDREIKRRGEGAKGCLHYLQVSSHVARRLTDFYCLAMNLPALCSPARVSACPFIYSTHPFTTCTTTFHSWWGVSATKSMRQIIFSTKNLLNPL